jgi:hypothetical protein
MLNWHTHTAGGECSSASCHHLAVWRFESEGVGSVYCDYCKQGIVDHLIGDDYDDGDYDDGPKPGEECGRWMNGRLTKSCSKAGSEECDFDCPYRGSLYK